MKSKLVLLSSLIIILAVTFFLAYTHKFLPAESDDCQQDVSHIGHLDELPPFHCLGHSEWDLNRDTWDHLHPWMTMAWHAENGFDVRHASVRETPIVE